MCLPYASLLHLNINFCLCFSHLSLTVTSGVCQRGSRICQRAVWSLELFFYPPPCFSYILPCQVNNRLFLFAITTFYFNSLMILVVARRRTVKHSQTAGVTEPLSFNLQSPDAAYESLHPNSNLSSQVVIILCMLPRSRYH